MPLLVFVRLMGGIVCGLRGYTFGCARLQLDGEMSSIFYLCCFATSVYCERISDIEA
jgi:hypothetical protein